jgi:spore maturation protein CgeB
MGLFEFMGCRLTQISAIKERTKKKFMGCDGVCGGKDFFLRNF